jgi:hypothetical protein
MLFGITSSVCCTFLKFSRRILIYVLSKSKYSQVRLPSAQETAAFKNAINARHSLLKDIWAVADGLKLKLQQSRDVVIQNMFYNGWTHDHYVSNVFVFTPDGTIAACTINAPGSMHDSVVAEEGGIYDKLETMFELYGARCVVDSAFCKSSHPCLIKSSQDIPITADQTDVLVAR